MSHDSYSLHKIDQLGSFIKTSLYELFNSTDLELHFELVAESYTCRISCSMHEIYSKIESVQGI